MLEKYFNQASQFQSQIEHLEPSNTARIDLEDLFIVGKSLIDSRWKESPSTSQQSVVENSTSLNTTTVISHPNPLPTLELPKFNGKHSEYLRFISRFNRLVNQDSSLSTIDKFNYLTACLSGPALKVIDSFQINEENYPKALDRLKSRFDNKADFQ